MIEKNYLYQNASDVRKNWSMTIDSVVHDRPAFINRTHDYVTMLESNLLLSMLSDYKFHITFESEDDGSITGYVEELELVENAPTKQSCIVKLVDAMKDYAADYYQDFNYWSTGKNRSHHIPYVIKILLSNDDLISEDIICQNGKS